MFDFSDRNRFELLRTVIMLPRNVPLYVYDVCNSLSGTLSFRMMTAVLCCVKWTTCGFRLVFCPFPLAVRSAHSPTAQSSSRPLPSPTSWLTLSTTSHLFWMGQSHSRPSLSLTSFCSLSQQSSRPFSEAAICHFITEQTNIWSTFYGALKGICSYIRNKAIKIFNLNQIIKVES